MRKLAKDLKVSDLIKMAGKVFTILEVEISDIGKQGKRKVRVIAKDDKGEKSVMVRPEDYPFES